MCRAHDLGSFAQGQGRSQVNGQNFVSNLTKLHRKIEHKEKVCRAQELDSYAQGQGHSQGKGQIAPKIRSE